jgi:hypothetical protein
MEWRPGGRIVQERLEKIKEELQEYYGLLNELQMGVTTKPPQKPNCLEVYDLYESIGLPLVAGGLLDQPHIWLMEYQTTKNQKELLEMILSAAKKE